MNNGTEVSGHTLHLILTTPHSHSLSQGRSNERHSLAAPNEVHSSIPHKTGLEGKIRPDRPD